MNARAIRLAPDATLTTVELERFGGSYLHSMYNHIGCQYVEVVQIQRLSNGNSLDMWMDEEGAMLAEPEVNASANLLLEHYGVITLGRIHGVVLLAESTPEGETVGLSNGALEYVTGVLASWQDEAAAYYKQRYER